MDKNIKIIAWAALAILIIIVCILMFWGTRTPDIIDFSNNEEENITTWEMENEPVEVNLEDDVMNDLESFFNHGNGYEDIEWDFWFINPNAE